MTETYSEKTPFNITISGAGKYGCALGYTVQEMPNRSLKFLVRRQEAADEINNQHTTKSIDENIKWNENVTATTSTEEALKNCDILLLCVPAQTMPDHIAAIRPHIEDKTVIVNCSKGMILKYQKFLCQIIEESYPDLKDRYCALVGPSFSSEMLKKWPTMVSIAGFNKDHVQKVVCGTWSPWFKGFVQDDVIGTELAGALKNVLALGAGLIEGLGYGYNTMACFVTRGVKEVQMISKTFGANPMTLIGLAGAGDIMLSCFGS